MQTDNPTVDLFFVFAFTYCKLRVYEKQEGFARQVLKAHGVEEFFTSKDSESWHEIDTRILLDLVGNAITKMLPSALPQPNKVTEQIAAALGINR